jgi:hypothetical protein
VTGTAWSSLYGNPMVTVSPVGLANGGTSTNDGADYGPDTTGTETAGIQEALNSVSSSGGTVYLLPGTFTLKAQVTSPVSWIDDPNILLNGVSGVAIIGAPGGTVVLTPGNTYNYSDILMLYKCSDIVISGIRFLANSSGLGSTDNAGGLAIESSQRIHVADCHLDSFHGSSIVGDWIFDSTFERVLITTSAGSNTIYRGFDVGFVQNIVVRDSSVSLPGGYGFNVFYNATTVDGNESGRTLNEEYSSNQIRLISSLWFSCSTGIVFSDVIDSAIVDCDVYLNAVTGINIISNTPCATVSPQGNEILGCRIWQNGAGGSNQGGAQINSNGQCSVEVRILSCDFYDNDAIGLAIVNPENIVVAQATLFRNRYTSNQVTAIGGTSGPIVGVGLSTSSEFPSLITACPGYNPQGFAVSTPAVPTSGTAYASTFPFPVAIRFVTASGASYKLTDRLGNVSTSAFAAVAGGYVQLDPGCSITPTYATLTWEFYGL